LKALVTSHDNALRNDSAEMPLCAGCMEQPDYSARFRLDVVSFVPSLRAYARLLTGNRDTADDLVQDTIVRALHGELRFKPGTNLRAWLFTIIKSRLNRARMAVAQFLNGVCNGDDLSKTSCIERLPEAADRFAY
jgi:hypothetical protein